MVPRQNVDRVEFDLQGLVHQVTAAVLFDNLEYDAVLKKGYSYKQS